MGVGVGVGVGGIFYFINVCLSRMLLLELWLLKLVQMVTPVTHG